MVPRNDITAVEIATPLDEVVATIKAEGHSRMPLYRGNLDDVVGMIHIRDVMRHWARKAPLDLNAIRRDILFAPQSMPIPALLKKCAKTRLHMAVVVDEYWRHPRPGHDRGPGGGNRRRDRGRARRDRGSRP